MEQSRRLIDYYLPPAEGFVLESLVATTYQVDFEFFEEELLAAALGVRSPVSRIKGFRSELERKLQKTEVSVLYDLGGCERLARLSPRIDPVPVSTRKLHSKISLLMWVREDAASDEPPDRRIRLIIGSANLTRQGFRHNYECIVSVDFGGKSTSQRSLLATAIGLVQQIGAESQAPQFRRQLAAFAAQADLLAVGMTASDAPVALVAADEVVPTIRKTWVAMSEEPPETVRIVSPFWAEGVSASDALVQLHQQLGSPDNMELVCRGERSPDGKAWLPVFDSTIALDLKKRLSSQIFLRATLPDVGLTDSDPPTDETGDEQEESELAAKMGAKKSNAPETQRALHAKLILLDSAAGSVLYTGSSNCTRKGLGLGAPPNHEAGFVFRLTPRQRKQIDGLLAFAGPATEVRSDALPPTVQPLPDEERVVPTFLAEIVAAGTTVTIRFREAVPADVVLLMPVPAKAGSDDYWLLYQGNGVSQPLEQTIVVDLSSCSRCDENLQPLAGNLTGQPVLPHVFVQVRWQGHSANFPVRFDDKAALPLLRIGRKPSESELIEYFLFGKEPDDGDDGNGLPGDDLDKRPAIDVPIDTRRILAYFIRRFVQAIPGIETEVNRAAYSRPSLDAVLRGPTSPLELAERAYASLAAPPRTDEPMKTPTAVAFQLTEILAALQRCQQRVTDAEMQECFVPVLTRCRELLDSLAAPHSELQSDAFHRYRNRILGDAG